MYMIRRRRWGAVSMDSLTSVWNMNTGRSRFTLVVLTCVARVVALLRIAAVGVQPVGALLVRRVQHVMRDVGRLDDHRRATRALSLDFLCKGAGGEGTQERHGPDGMTEDLHTTSPREWKLRVKSGAQASGWRW
jgi:hypothetical protein